ncbi:MAG: hypothetical protein HY815_01845 [Candidatus Riflebacteria bacterium]|nr:hypothetical protein [Candidatus Riflebacteria bacterium]
MTDPTDPNPERRRLLSTLAVSLAQTIETDAGEFRRLVKSFLRRPQMIFLRELLRNGPARRTPETEAAWRGMRQALLPVLEKGEVKEPELPWFLAWAARLTPSRPLKLERPPMGLRPEGDARRGDPAGRRPDMPGRGPDRGFGPGGPRGPRDGGPMGRGGGRPDRRDPRGAPRMPPQPKEIDTRWEQLKKFKFDEDPDKKE